MRNPLTSLPIECDANGDGIDDVLSAADLPGFLTFDPTGDPLQSIYLDHVLWT